MIKKRIGAICMAVMTLCSLAACGGGNGGGNNGNGMGVTITVINFDGGVGTEWLYNAAKRFETKMKDKTYTNGETGVKVDITPTMNVSTAAMATAGYNIYFIEGQANVYTYAQERKLLNLNDVLVLT